MTTNPEDLKFYLDKLYYYQQILNYPGAKSPSGYKGYGEIEFYHKDIKSVEWTYNFWLDGMIRFIETNQCRNCKKKVSKK